MATYPSLGLWLSKLKLGIEAELSLYRPHAASTIVDGLLRLARFETRKSFVRALERRFAYPPGSCAFEKQIVFRQQLGRKAVVQCLVMQVEDALPTAEVAVAILREWMRAEELDYYRIAAPSKNRILLYEVPSRHGVYQARDRGRDTVELSDITPEPTDWDIELRRARELAVAVDTSLEERLQRAG